MKLWAQTNGRNRTHWHLVTLNAMRQGWGLRGFQRWQERTDTGRINPRTGQRIVTRTELTPERIARLVEKQRERG